MRIILRTFLMFWFGVIMWLAVECNQDCRSISSSECDIPTGAWILGFVCALATFIVCITGNYPDDKNR